MRNISTNALDALSDPLASFIPSYSPGGKSKFDSRIVGRSNARNNMAINDGILDVSRERGRDSVVDMTDATIDETPRDEDDEDGPPPLLLLLLTLPPTAPPDDENDDDGLPMPPPGAVDASLGVALRRWVAVLSVMINIQGGQRVANNYYMSEGED